MRLDLLRGDFYFILYYFSFIFSVSYYMVWLSNMLTMESENLRMEVYA
jgi:hypothetical protein